MNYTKEQVNIQIKSACNTQKEIDYNFFKKVINSLTVKELINYDYNFTEKNLDVNLNESDLSEIRDCWIDIDLDVIKNCILNKVGVK